MPKVWNKRNPNCPKEAVYVGRPSRWGNPFKLTDPLLYGMSAENRERIREAIAEHHFEERFLTKWEAAKKDSSFAGAIWDSYNFADWILAIPGLAILADQTLPALAKVEVPNQPEIARWYDGYAAAQQDMLAPGWKKMEARK